MSFSATAKKLGFHFTDDMRIDAHVQDICRKVYIDIQRISSIHHILSIDATKTLLCAFVLPKLDYCNSLSIVAKCICWKDFRRLIVSSKTNFSMSQTKSHFTQSHVSALAAH